MLTIAGFDPSSGAGVTADLAVFAAHGFFGTAAITALTVQSTIGVRRVKAVDGELLRETLDCLRDDLPPDGIKIGMLGTSTAVGVVAEFLSGLRAKYPKLPVVLDPVLRSSTGSVLLEEQGVEALYRDVLPLVDWVTPNLSELEALTDLPIRSRTDMERGAKKICSNVLGLGIVVTGGHLEACGEVSAPDLVMAPNGDCEWLTGEWITSRSTHGTGCAFSSAMASELTAGADAFEAARRAKLYVAGAIRHAIPLGKGKGPMNLAWQTKPGSLVILPG